MLPHQLPFTPMSACSGWESENYSPCLGKRNQPERLGDLPKVTEQRQSKLSTPGWTSGPDPTATQLHSHRSTDTDSSSLHRTRARRPATTWEASPGCGSSGLTPAGFPPPSPALLLQRAHPHPQALLAGEGAEPAPGGRQRG